MRSHIDWITFTMTPRYGTYNTEGMSVEDDYATAIEQGWLAAFDPDTLAKAFGGQWQKQEKSRAPYTDAWTQSERGITLFAGISLNHMCVEISGSGCEILIEKGLMEQVLRATQTRVTRIDIACDIETQTKPSEFVATLKHRKMRSSGRQMSASGETEYVGSKTSERFARVYRYNKPHPRAHLLRIEHVFHKASAKRVAYEILASGIESVSLSAGDAFGWTHADWQPSVSKGVDLSIVSPERNGGKTIHWLVNSVAPAFQRLCADGTIRDPEEFIRQYFLSGNKDA